MDIGKYLDLITRQQMWFSRAIIFRRTDPYEGTLTKSDRDTMVRVIEATTKDDLKQILPAWSRLISDTPTKSLYWLQLLFLHRVSLLDRNIYSNSISCWHENASESDAMWALYAQRDAGIAIKSTISRVLDALASSERSMCIGKVNYETSAPLSAMGEGIYDSLLIKRSAFQHENEVRIIAMTLDGYEAPEWTTENQSYILDLTKDVPSGVYIDCDIQALIEEVVISPLTPPYSAEAVKRISQNLLPTIPIRRSALLTKDDDIPRDLFSPELEKVWNHWRLTGWLRDIDEIPS